MRQFLLLIACTLAIFGLVTPAYAAEGATILFKSGEVVKIRDGYKEIANGLKKLKSKGGKPLLALNLDAHVFYVDLSEIVSLCRAPCSSVEIVQRGKSSSRR